jgi:hypothetical protein
VFHGEQQRERERFSQYESKNNTRELRGMQEVGTVEGAVAAWISNYYLSQNKLALVQSS